jgi:hypothetical protein
MTTTRDGGPRVRGKIVRVYPSFLVQKGIELAIELQTGAFTSILASERASRWDFVALEEDEASAGVKVTQELQRVGQRLQFAQRQLDMARVILTGVSESLRARGVVRRTSWSLATPLIEQTTASSSSGSPETSPARLDTRQSKLSWWD